MAKVWVLDYHNIDCMKYMFLPDAVIEQFRSRPRRENILRCTKEQAREAFLHAGWEGDGDLSIIWIPPFLLDYDTHGRLVWHVKQQNNGTSWICSPMPFDCHTYDKTLYGWRQIDVADEEMPSFE